jgi:hypothetical protein
VTVTPVLVGAVVIERKVGAVWRYWKFVVRIFILVDGPLFSKTLIEEVGLEPEDSWLT